MSQKRSPKAKIDLADVPGRNTNGHEVCRREVLSEKAALKAQRPNWTEERKRVFRMRMREVWKNRKKK